MGSTHDGAEHPHDLIFHPGRIGEGTKQIEDGARAELGPHLGDMAHGGMMGRREHEAEPARLDRARDRVRLARDIDAERGEHVGRARARGDRPVAVLGHGHAGAGNHESGAGGDIVRALAVAARAASIDGAFRRAYFQRARPERAGGAGDFFHRLAADAHAHEESADLRLGRGAGHDQLEGLGRFGLGEGSAFGHLAQRSADIRKRRRARARGARGHRPLLLALGRARAARRGRGRESWQAADGRAPRRCSRDGTARHARDSAYAGAP